MFGFANIYMQLYQGTWSLQSKIVLMIVVVATMFKTFESLRVIQSYSYIVTMIRSVIYDLRVFFSFYTVVLLSFSMILDVVGRSKSEEYKEVGSMAANILATLRLSLGDFDFSQISDQKLVYMHYVFWAVWVFMVAFSSLIFLNFIIAEVGNSYAKCRDNITPTIYQERAILVAEAEDLYSVQQKDSDKLKFPKYIVTRKTEI